MEERILLDVLKRYDAGDVFAVFIPIFIVWVAVWHLFLGEWLRQHKVGTFAYTLYEIGAGGIFGIFLMLLIFLVLLITSIQAAVYIGGPLIFGLIMFWAIVVAFVVSFIKAMRKK